MAHFTKNSDKCNQYLKKSGEIDPRCHQNNSSTMSKLEICTKLKALLVNLPKTPETYIVCSRHENHF